MEEIDIIELLHRVKEGKTPKEIVIKNKVFQLVPNYEVRGLQFWYSAKDNMFTEYWLDTGEINSKTKIKILDKPIIEELKVEEGHTDLSGLPYTVYPTKDEIIEKINQIIKHINKGGK